MEVGYVEQRRLPWEAVRERGEVEGEALMRQQVLRYLLEGVKAEVFEDVMFEVLGRWRA